MPRKFLTLSVIAALAAPYVAPKTTVRVLNATAQFLTTTAARIQRLEEGK